MRKSSVDFSRLVRLVGLGSAAHSWLFGFLLEPWHIRFGRDRTRVDTLGRLLDTAIADRLGERLLWRLVRTRTCCEDLSLGHTLHLRDPIDDPFDFVVAYNSGSIVASLSPEKRYRGLALLGLLNTSKEPQRTE